MPDQEFPKQGVFSDSRVKIIPTGLVTPPFKRDIGAKSSASQILAFLDDDVYPDPQWLKESLNIFGQEDSIACVCGPAVTPSNDSLLQKASGLVYSSFLVSANHTFRYLPQKARIVFDFPSCNFLIRKHIFDQVGGFDKPYWPGEDTFLCLKVLATSKKMLYDPKVLVFHHRRKMFKGHLKQVVNYALHRGYFAKRYPKTSLRWEYFIPSLFVLGLAVGGVLAIFFPLFRLIFLVLLSFYTIAVIAGSLMGAFSLKETSGVKIKLFILGLAGIIVTHLAYGIYFIKGLMAKKMPEED